MWPLSLSPLVVVAVTLPPPLTMVKGKDGTGAPETTRDLMSMQRNESDPDPRTGRVTRSQCGGACQCSEVLELTKRRGSFRLDQAVEKLPDMKWIRRFSAKDGSREGRERSMDGSSARPPGPGYLTRYIR